MPRFSTNGIVIVGAGPYGLLVAAHLRRNGLPFRIFGSPMQSWRSNMPAGIFLKSEGRASSLSDPAGSYMLKAHCEQYGLSYGDYGVPCRWRRLAHLVPSQPRRVLRPRRHGHRRRVVGARDRRAGT
jgi:hypothetical protein